MSEMIPSLVPLTVDKLNVYLEGRLLLDVEQLSVSPGDLLCIVGPNGAGKSLLLKTMAGLHSFSKTAIRWGGHAPSRQAYSKLGMLLQTPIMLRRTVSANLDFALKAQTQLPRAERRQAVQQALALANMHHMAELSARVLSGGERQRLALVRALACKPELLLLDEPTANMDPASTAWFEDTLRQAHQQGLSVVMVTHDLNQARRLATRIVLLHRGTIAENSDTGSFFNHPRSQEALAFSRGDLLF